MMCSKMMWSWKYKHRCNCKLDYRAWRERMRHNDIFLTLKATRNVILLHTRRFMHQELLWSARAGSYLESHLCRKCVRVCVWEKNAITFVSWGVQLLSECESVHFPHSDIFHSSSRTEPGAELSRPTCTQNCLFTAWNQDCSPGQGAGIKCLCGINQ